MGETALLEATVRTKRRGYFISPRRLSLLLPPAWRGETLCGARWRLTGAPEAHTPADCQPGRDLEARCGQSLWAGTS